MALLTSCAGVFAGLGPVQTAGVWILQSQKSRLSDLFQDHFCYYFGIKELIDLILFKFNFAWNLLRDVNLGGEYSGNI